MAAAVRRSAALVLLENGCALGGAGRSFVGRGEVNVLVDAHVVVSLGIATFVVYEVGACHNSGVAKKNRRVRREAAQARHVDGYVDPSRTPVAPLSGAVASEVELIEAAAMVKLVGEVLADSVERCRDEGMSWHRIGLILGMTGEGARRRYLVRAGSSI